MKFQAPRETRSSTVISGAHTIVFPGKPFQREVRSIYVDNVVTSAVELYLNTMAPSGLVGGNPIGNKNTFVPVSKLMIPAGHQLIVRWPSATAAANVGSCALECDGEM